MIVVLLGERFLVLEERSVDFFDVKNDLETLIAPRGARFEPVMHPALHPGRGAQKPVQGVAEPGLRRLLQAFLGRRGCQ